MSDTRTVRWFYHTIPFAVLFLFWEILARAVRQLLILPPFSDVVTSANRYDGILKIQVSLICILSLAACISPVHAAVGDLILDTDFYLHFPHLCEPENFSKSSTLLKEGYSISLDGMRWVKAGKGSEICVTNYSISKNGDVVERVRVIGEGYFCYNKTIEPIFVRLKLKRYQ